MKLPLFEFFFTFFDICYKKSNSRCEKYNRKKYRSIYLCSIFKVVHSIKHLFASKSHLKVCTLVFKNIFSTLIHTSQESFYKWTKISSLEINILEINKISLICLDFFILKFPEPLQSYCCPVQKICPERLNWLGRLAGISEVDFKKKSRPFFIIIFKLKNGNFKTRDFSPLIERVLAGVVNSPIVMCLEV